MYSVKLHPAIANGFGAASKSAQAIAQLLLELRVPACAAHGLERRHGDSMFFLHAIGQVLSRRISQAVSAAWLATMCDAAWLAAMCDAAELAAMCDLTSWSAIWITLPIALSR